MESSKEKSEQLSIYTHVEHRLSIVVIMQLLTLIFNRKWKKCADEICVA